MRKRWTIFVVAAALALVAASCGSRVRDWPDDALAQVQTTGATTAQPDADTTSTTGAGVPTTIERRAGTTTTVRGGSQAGAAIPSPQPGTYVYDLEARFPASEDEPASTERQVLNSTWSTSASAGAITATLRESVPGTPGASISTYRTTSTERTLMSVRYEGDDDSDADDCPFKPYVTEKLPLKVGLTWHNEEQCTDADGYITKTTRDFVVTGAATLAVGGKSINAMVIKVTEKTTEIDPEDPEDPFTSSSTLTGHVDPTTLLMLKEELTQTDDGEPGFVIQRTLRSTTPK